MNTEAATPEVPKLRYHQFWSAYNSAQTNEKAMFLSLLYGLCSGIDEPIQTKGRPWPFDGRYDLRFGIQGLFNGIFTSLHY